MPSRSASSAETKKLLVANRSEIAIRIMRAANELRLRTVAIYAQEDRFSMHRFKADEAYVVGEGKGPVGAYLDIEGIVALAKDKGVGHDSPGIRLPFGERGVREGLCEGWHYLRRTAP
jgi:pyruvate carboxylase